MVAGDVVHAIFVVARGGPKNKFLVLVKPETGWGFLINTRPFPPALAAQVRVDPIELTFLAHESFIDTSAIVCIPDLQQQASSGAASVVGHVLMPLRRRICAAIAAHGILPKQHEDLVAQRFGISPP